MKFQNLHAAMQQHYAEFGLLKVRKGSDNAVLESQTPKQVIVQPSPTDKVSTWRHPDSPDEVPYERATKAFAKQSVWENHTMSEVYMWSFWSISSMFAHRPKSDSYYEGDDEQVWKLINEVQIGNERWYY